MLSAVERKIEQFVADMGDKEVTALYAKLPHGKRLRVKLILKIAGSELSVVKTAAVVEILTPISQHIIAKMLGLNQATVQRIIKRNRH